MAMVIDFLRDDIDNKTYSVVRFSLLKHMYCLKLAVLGDDVSVGYRNSISLPIFNDVQVYVSCF